ncbi:MAG: cardiolipin synthase [Bacteroidia bacterium]
MSLLQWILLTGGLVYLASVISTLLVILFDHSSPPKAMAWMLVIIFFPILGLGLYATFGRNWRKQKMFSRKSTEDETLFPELNFTDADWKNPDNITLKENADIIRLLQANNKAPLTHDNRVKILQNGGETFEAILDAIGKAKKHVHLEYYIFEDGKIGQRFKKALVEKAKQGVKIRLLYDAVGSWELKKEFLRSLKHAGIDVAEFFPVRFPILASRVNYRNHRKIVVVDNEIAFVGGINVSDEYIGNDPELGGHWRDTHLQIIGSAAQCLHAVFIRDWYFAKGEKIELEESENPLPDQDIFIQIASSGPDSDYASIMQAYFTAITSAKNHVYISTPYFVPNQAISTAIKTAAMRGIEVRMLVPEKSDSKFLNYGLRAYLEEFLEVGVKVHFYTAGFNHGKLMMVDSRFCSIGTANLDIRSFDQNFEVNALIYDRKVTEELEAAFKKDLDDAYEITLDDFRHRKKRDKFMEALARLVSPLL